jgi:hypothetical protein
VFDLLIYLLRDRELVVSKDDLIDGVWGGRIVSESTLTSRINAARRAVGDSGAEQALILAVQAASVLSPTHGRAFVMPGLVPGIQPTASDGKGGGLDSGDKRRNDTVRTVRVRALVF